MRKLRFAFIIIAIISFSFIFVACGRIEINNSETMTTAAQKINPTVTVSLKQDRTYFENEVISRYELKTSEFDTPGILSVKENVILKVGTNIVHWIFTPSDQMTYRKLEGDLTVNAVQIEPTSISVQSMPQKLDGYKAFDNFEQTGMSLKVTYNNGTTRYLTNKSDWTISYESGKNYCSANENKVVVNCLGFSTEIALNEKVSKFKVQIPDIKQKNYNGQSQVAEILNNDNARHSQYYNLNSFSAKNVGTHTVTLTLTDFANCMWSDETNSKNLNVNFVINKSYREISLKPVYSIWTGSVLAIPQDYVLVKDYESQSSGEAAKTIITYFVDSECLTMTNSINSGSEQTGSAPKNLGNYYVKVTYLGDDNYLDSTSVITSFNIIENDTSLFDEENNFGWRYLILGENTKDLPFLSFEAKMVNGLKVLYLNLIVESNVFSMPFESGVVHYINNANFMIYDKNGDEIQLQVNNNNLCFNARNEFESNNQFIFEKWVVPAYVGNYQCDRSMFGGETDTLKITASNGEIYFELKYSYRFDELSTQIAGVDEKEGYVALNNESNLQFYTLNDFGKKELISSVYIEDQENPPTTFVLLLGPTYQEEFNFVKVG